MKTHIAIGLLMLVGATSCSHNESTKPQRKDITDAVFASGNIFDENEYLFAAVFNEHVINIYGKDGILVNSIPCSGTRPTSCAFDPSGKLGLVITEAEHGKIISYPEFGKGLPIFYG